MADNYVNQVEFLDADGEVTSTHDIQDIDNAELARIDGSYEDMTVGQLVSKVEVVDKVPYLFRTSGGSADIGNREYDEIVGGTVTWNQLAQKSFIPSGGTLAQDGDVFTYTATTVSSASYGNNVRVSNASSLLSGHKMLVMADIKPSKTKLIGIWLLRTAGMGDQPVVVRTCTQGVWNKISGILEVPDVVGTTYGIMQVSFNVTTSTGGAVGDTEQFKNVMFIDLTAMFNPTIADYIYSLDQTTPGAGVAKLKEWGFFAKDYYEYDPGTFKHVEGLISHKTVGFNAFNVETGVAKVVGGDLYQITGAYTSISIDGTAITPDAQGLFTPPADGTLTVVGGDATTTCVHLVWSGYKNGEYEPYREHVYPLDSSVILRGVPMQDENGELYYDGDIYRADGTVERRYGIVDLGTLNWYRYSSSYPNLFYVPGDILGSKLRGFLKTTANYTFIVDGGFVGFPQYQHHIGFGHAGRLYINDTAYTDVTSFKASLAGKMMVYEFATPTTEQAEPYQEVQIVDDFGTEEYVTDSIIPVGHTTRYPANLRDKLQRLPDSAGADGDYIVRQSGSQMALVPITEAKELPETPTANGTYRLTATVVDGTPTFAWVSA